MESSRPKEKRKNKKHITPKNGDRHEKNEQELDGTRKEGPGQNGLENAGLKKWTARMQLDNLDFADDLALLSQTQQQMQEKTNSVAAASAAVGLKIHKGKSRILRYNTVCTNPIKIDGEDLEDVKTFTYLGSIIDEHGRSDAHVKTRIGKLSTQNTSDPLARHYQKQPIVSENKPDASGGRNEGEVL
ncbi:unnamed protein product [Schistosoma mattheei]|uniref:Uncharacterized protein n=1 Tax=Schistosoma mattheei TaxID=31246 RepID=A0A183PPU8_9TREM|nr:unnamed protein product [Schistosoma mattheei]